jgi:hypothetical protein
MPDTESRERPRLLPRSDEFSSRVSASAQRTEPDRPLNRLIPAYEKAKAALAQAITLEEVKEIDDQADALRACARILKPELEIELVKFKIKVARRLGEISAELPKVPCGPGRGRRRESIPDTRKPFRSKGEVLEAAGIGKTEAYLNERLAKVPQETVDNYFAEKDDQAVSVSFTDARKALLVQDHFDAMAGRKLREVLNRTASERGRVHKLRRRQQASVASRKALERIFKLAPKLSEEQIFELIVMLVMDLTDPRYEEIIGRLFADGLVRKIAHHLSERAGEERSTFIWRMMQDQLAHVDEEDRVDAEDDYWGKDPPARENIARIVPAARKIRKNGNGADDDENKEQDDE